MTLDRLEHSLRFKYSATLSPDPAFVEKLRILIEDLTTPTDDLVPPFLRIFDADPQWPRYLFGRQRPETQVEADVLQLCS